MRQSRLYTLDGMRGLAAVLVLIYHLGVAFGISFRLVDGILAVDFFFCLSGFVLARAHGGELQRGDLRCSRFMLLRAVRIGPMLLLGTLVGAMLVPWQHESFSPHGPAVMPTVLLSLLTLPFPAVGGEHLLWVNGTFWSLFAELAVNLAYGLCFTLRRRPPFLLVAAACAIPFIAISFWHNSASATLMKVHNLPTVLLRAGTSFFIGVACEHIASRMRTPSGMPAWLPAAALVVLLVIPRGYGTLSVVYSVACILVAFPALVLLAATARQSDPAGAWSSLGDASFTLYAIHSPLVLLAGYYAVGWGRAEQIALLVAIVLTLPPVSLVIARRVDAPARGLLRNLLVRREARPLATTRD